MPWARSFNSNAIFQTQLQEKRPLHCLENYTAPIPLQHVIIGSHFDNHKITMRLYSLAIILCSWQTMARKWSSCGRRLFLHWYCYSCSFNCRAVGRNGCPPFYMLVDLLHRESKAVNLRLKLLSRGKLQKRIRKQTNENNAILFELWDAYNNQTITAKTLLMKAAKTVKTK